MNALKYSPQGPRRAAIKVSPFTDSLGSKFRVLFCSGTHFVVLSGSQTIAHNIADKAAVDKYVNYWNGFSKEPSWRLS